MEEDEIGRALYALYAWQKWEVHVKCQETWINLYRTKVTFAVTQVKV
jgi:hypothetical protein